MKKVKDFDVVSRHKSQKVFLVIILLAQCMCLIFFGNLKEGYHMDEVCSYTLSNSYYKPFPLDRDKWLGNDYFDNCLQVKNSDAFKYDSVYYNQTIDVHPPLYYFAFHTLCSFFQNTFSKWLGISLNIIFFTGVIISLFFLSRELLRDDRLSILVSVLFGFSIGAISMVMFIRMYMLLMLWVVLQTYFILKLINCQDPFACKKLYLRLFFITLAGFLTHYYFLIFALCISTVYGIYTLINKKYSELLKFSKTIIFAVVLGVFLFPMCMKHFLSSERGPEAMSNAINFKGYLSGLYGYFKIVNDKLFAGTILIFLLVFVVLRMLQDKTYSLIKFKIQPLIILLPCIFYFLIISKIAPYITDRYISPIYPSLLLMFIYVFKLIFKDKVFLVGSIASVLIVVAGFCTQKVDYLYPGYNHALDVSESYSDKKCIVVADESWKVTGASVEFSKYRDVYVRGSDTDNADSEGEIQGGGVIIYVEKEIDKEKVLKSMQETTNLSNSLHLYENEYFEAYYIS